MRCWPRCFGAAALIDGNVYEDAARFHRLQHRARYQFWRVRSWDEDSSDQEIDIRHKLAQMRLARIKRVRAAHGDVEKSHSLKIDFENRHVRSEPGRHPRRVHTGSTTANNNNAPGQHSRYPAEQNAAATIMLRQKIRSHHHRHTPSDFAHRLK